MVVNFRTREISRSARKLTRILTLIKIYILIFTENLYSPVKALGGRLAY
jgi:hypothetical protein